MDVIKRARMMRAKFLERYNYGRLPLAINAAKFADTVSDETGIEIVKKVVPMSNEHLRGLLYRENDEKAVVLISDKNNECWKRFTFVKEISHLFLDGKEDFIVDSERLAECLSNRELADDGKYNLDKRGVVAAVEILIPESLKDHILHEYNSIGKTAYAIAYNLKVPKKYVEYRLNQWMPR